MDEIVEIVARAIREGRKCGTEEEPLMVPCPFCMWTSDDRTSEHDETGCVWIAERVVAALEAAPLVSLRYGRWDD